MQMATLHAVTLSLNAVHRADLSPACWMLSLCNFLERIVGFGIRRSIAVTIELRRHRFGRHSPKFLLLKLKACNGWMAVLEAFPEPGSIPQPRPSQVYSSQQLAPKTLVTFRCEKYVN